MNSKWWFALACVAVVLVAVLGWYATHPKHCYRSSDPFAPGEICHR